MSSSFCAKQRRLNSHWALLLSLLLIPVVAIYGSSSYQEFELRRHLSEYEKAVFEIENRLDNPGIVPTNSSFVGKPAYRLGDTVQISGRLKYLPDVLQIDAVKSGRSYFIAFTTTTFDRSRFGYLFKSTNEQPEGGYLGIYIEYRHVFGSWYRFSA